MPGGIVLLSNAMQLLADRAGLAADQLDRAGESASGTGRAPSAADQDLRRQIDLLRRQISSTRDVDKLAEMNARLADLKAQLAASDKERKATEPTTPAATPALSFRAGGRKIGQKIDETTDAIDDARDSAGDLQDELARANEFFRTSPMGKLIEKLFAGYGLGTAEGGEAVSALKLVENYLKNEAELRSGKASPQRTAVLMESLVKQADFFQRIFGTLGSIQDVARELQKFRQMFPSYNAGSSTGSTSGTLGKPRTTSCAPTTSLDLLVKAGAL